MDSHSTDYESFTGEKINEADTVPLTSVAAREDDFAPDPPDAAERKSVLRNVAGFIIVTEFCERLAYYGFAGSLVLFFQSQLDFSNATADVQFSAWSGVCYITPLLGGKFISIVQQTFRVTNFCNDSNI